MGMDKPSRPHRESAVIPRNSVMPDIDLREDEREEEDREEKERRKLQDPLPHTRGSQCR